MPEGQHNKLPKALRLGRPQAGRGRLTEAQVRGLAESRLSDLFTAIAWRIKEKQRWVSTGGNRSARVASTNVLIHANDGFDPDRSPIGSSKGIDNVD